MGEYVIKLPDVGEGVAEAELVEWLVEEGRNVREDDPLASVMTDKATVEIPSPVEGKIKWLGPKIGDVVAVGSPIIRLEIDGEGNVAIVADAADAADATVDANRGEPASEESASPDALKSNSSSEPVATPSSSAVTRAAPMLHAEADASFARARESGPRAPQAEGARPLASPAVRRRAMEAGVDLRLVPGAGPAGRISHEDLDQYIAGGRGSGSRRTQSSHIDEIPVVGLRRKIAEKMALSKSRIAHITYVDEVDVTALEETRAQMNAAREGDQPKLTILPFLMRALARALQDHPHMNALYDDEAGLVRQYGAMHMGVAAQTDNGLVVPVVRHVEALGLWGCAREVARLSDAARTGAAGRDELSGSTITITSLGALGGIVTTPVINHPEVAIIGVNKIQTLPSWDGSQFTPRKKMNLSSSFDHRVIDGYDAAVFIQRIKALLETPAMIFAED